MLLARFGARPRMRGVRAVIRIDLRKGRPAGPQTALQRAVRLGALLHASRPAGTVDCASAVHAPSAIAGGSDVTGVLPMVLLRLQVRTAAGGAYLGWSP